jgi:hypothetical protein
MPRSTEHTTCGYFVAASPNGHCSATIWSVPPLASAWAAKPWAVSASATVASAARVSVGRHASGDGEPVVVADRLRHGGGLVGVEHLERACQQRGEEVVAPGREVQRCVELAGAIALRRPARSLVASELDGQIPAGGQLLEMVAGDVGMEVEPLGDLGGGDAVPS